MIAASIFAQVAAIVLIVSVAVTAIGWVTAPERRPPTSLGLAQAAAVGAGMIAISLRQFLTSDPIDAVWMVAVFTTAVLAIARHRRGEPLLPGM